MTATAARGLLMALALAAGAFPAGAADQRGDPDWPCVQRKVPELSLGQMWPGPVPEGDWRDDPAITRLAPVMAARRTSLDEVKALAEDYAAGIPEAERPERMARLYAAVLDRIDSDRGAVIGGISRYARKQAGLAEKVKAEEADLAALKAAPEPDLDRVEEAQDNLNWDIRVYRDRSQSLTYVCETPTLLEQRAFAIARVLSGGA